MQKKLPEYFGLLPKAGLIVKRVESFREEPGGAQHYFGGTPDGSRPGIFYAHLSDMNAMPKFQLEDVAYHEGVPGHHLQISIAHERTGLPKFRTQYGYGCLRRRMGVVRGVAQQGDGVLRGSLFGLRTTCRRNLARGSPGGRYRSALEGVDRGAGGPVLSCEFAAARDGRFARRSAATSSTPVRPPATRSA